MPEVKPFESRVSGLTPSERGTNAREAAARRTGAFYNQAADAITSGARAQADAAGDVAKSFSGVADAVATGLQQQENYAGNRAVAKGAADGTQLAANLNDLWNKTVKEAADRDPNDPTVAAKFREEQLEPALQKFQEAYTGTDHGRQWSENFVAKTRQHFFETTAAGMSTLASVAVRSNVDKLSNASSNMAFKSGDTHTADYLISNLRDSIGAMVDSSNVKGTEAAKLKLELVQQQTEKLIKAGAIGAIAKSSNPERTAQEWADKYPDYLNGADANALAKNARAQVHAARIDENNRLKNEELQKKKVSEAAESDYLKKVYSDDPKVMGEVSARGIANDQRLSNPTKEKLIRLVDREMKPESDAKVSAATSRDVFARIYAPAGDPNKITDVNEITQLRIDGKLTKADYNDLRTEIVNARNPEGEKLGAGINDLIKAVKPSIDKSNPLMGKIDPDGPLNLYRFEQDLRKKAAEYRRDGKDPHDLLDPAKPDFMGKPETLTGYQKTLQQSTSDAARRLMNKPSVNLTGDGSTVTGVQTTNVPPKENQTRKPGESPDAYLKRMGIK